MSAPRILLASTLLWAFTTAAVAQEAEPPIHLEGALARDEIVWDPAVNRFVLLIAGRVVVAPTAPAAHSTVQLFSLGNDKLIPPLSLGTLPAATSVRLELRLTSTDLLSQLAQARRKVRWVGRCDSGGFDETVELGDKQQSLLRLARGYLIDRWRPERDDEGLDLVQTVIVPPELAGHRLRLSWDGYQHVLARGVEVNARVIDAATQTTLSRVRSGDRLALRLRARRPGEPPPPLQVRLAPLFDGLEEVALLHRSSAYLLGREEDDSPRLGAICAALAAGDAPAAGKAVAAAQADIAAARAIAKQFTVFLVGNAHIDVAWRWTWPEAIEFCRKTYSQALAFMDEYPDFTYSQNQAQTYEWMQDRYPEIFQAIKRRAAEGRWEVVGGTWVENDLVLPTGESTVRQFLYGKRYFKKELGVDVKVGWMVDIFGYPGFLPQVLQKCGIDSFVGMKCNATNDTTPLPYMLFDWRGVDGTTVTYFTSRWGWYDRAVTPEALSQDARGMRERTHPLTRPAGDLSPRERLKTRPAGDLSPGERLKTDVMVLYGVGDSGGGPTREQINAARQIDSMPTAPNIRLVTSQVYFDAQKHLKLPVIEGDLYQQAHQGTFTSQARAKDNNRRAELLLLAAEKWSWLSRHFADRYPADDLAAAWKLLLFNQGHDILPGSSIPRVYADSYKQFEEIFQRGGGALDAALDALARQADTRGAGAPIVVFNSLPWPRTDILELPLDKLPQALRSGLVATDPDGNPAPVQCTRDGSVLILCRDVPSTGFAVYHLSPGAWPSTRDSANGAHFRMQCDPATGNLTRLYDVARQRDVLSATGALLQLALEQHYRWDAWNIATLGEYWNVESATRVQEIESGPIRSVIRVQRGFNRVAGATPTSTFTTDYILYHDLPRIDVGMDIDWHEQHLLLKCAFPLNVDAATYTCEMPFSVTVRPGKPETPQEKAQFEVPMQRWADLSQPDYGVSFLTQNKYGCDCHDDVFRLTLLKSSTYPDPGQDQGRQRFRFALYPHAGDWREAQTVERGYEFNEPLRWRIAGVQPGPLEKRHSFITGRPCGVLLETVKRGEDDPETILRLYELFGRTSNAEYRFDQPLLSARETDLLEWDKYVTETRGVSVQGDTLHVELRPYEIKTLRVDFQE